MNMKLFVLAFVLLVACCQTNAKSLSEAANHGLQSFDKPPTQNHKILTSTATMAVSLAKMATWADVKLMTKIISRRLVASYKAAKTESKGKSWVDYFKALFRGAIAAVAGALPEFMAEKAKQQLLSLAGGAGGSVRNFLKKF